MVTNKSFPNVGKFMYLETSVTNQNYTPEEIESNLNSRNASESFYLAVSSLKT
jgi:hypothetical protein